MLFSIKICFCSFLLVWKTTALIWRIILINLKNLENISLEIGTDFCSLLESIPNCYDFFCMGKNVNEITQLSLFKNLVIIFPAYTVLNVHIDCWATEFLQTGPGHFCILITCLFTTTKYQKENLSFHSSIREKPIQQRNFKKNK